VKLSERLEKAARGGDTLASNVSNALLREAAALARRVEDAEAIEMPSRRGPALSGPTLMISTSAAERMGLDGQRVRLVPDAGQGGGDG